jgi:hypothetical protein
MCALKRIPPRRYSRFSATPVRCPIFLIDLVRVTLKNREA